MIISAPPDYERYAILLNPLLIPEAEGRQTMERKIGLLPVPNAAATPDHGDKAPYEKSDTSSFHNKKQIILRKSVPFARPLPETGRGQNMDIWA